MNVYILVVIIFLAFLIFFQIMIYFPPWFLGNTIDFEILNFNRSLINYKVSSPSLYETDLKLVVFSANSTTPVYSNLYVYLDPTYQQATSQDNKALSTLIDYLYSELAGSGYDKKIEVVNASSLAALLSAEKIPKDSILIIPTGALPDTVYTLNKNLVKPWIEGGGTLFWVGSNFGYFSAEKTQSDINQPNQTSRHPKYNGTINFLGQNIVIDKDWSARALYDSNYSSSLGLSYSKVSRALSWAAVKSSGGLILGKTDNTSVSIGSIPIGQGKVVIFGGLMTGPGFTYNSDQLLVAKDMAQVIKSGVLASFNMIATKNINAGGNNVMIDSIHIKNGENIKSKYYNVYLFQPTLTSEGKLYRTVTLNISKMLPDSK